MRELCGTMQHNVRVVQYSRPTNVRIGTNINVYQPYVQIGDISQCALAEWEALHTKLRPGTKHAHTEVKFYTVPHASTPSEGILELTPWKG